MKKLFFHLIIIVTLHCLPSYSQYIQDSRIDSIVNLISQQSISIFMRELSGDTTTMVGGNSKLIFSRYCNSPANDWAAQYIYQKFQSYGLNTSYWIVDSLCKNVIGMKIGTKYPNQKYIIGAHYDNAIHPVLPQLYDTVHGADDNASGVCAVLEAARLIANMSFEYTVVFAAWDEEEVEPNFYHGSRPYADSAFALGDSIKAYINLDMIAYDANQSNKIQLCTDSASVFYAHLSSSVFNNFIPSFNPIISVSSNWASDIRPFYNRGYRGMMFFEYNFNTFYHTINDKFSNAKLPYCTSVIKGTIATLMTLALNKSAYFEHKPIVNSSDTTSRIAIAIIRFPNKLPYINNAPRLCYKVNSSSYSYVNAFYRNVDTFKFFIPGVPPASTVFYYLAAQDSVYGFVCTYPVGGSGVNPPGTTPPQSLFFYEIYTDNNQCSNTLPKPINDFQYTNDTIQVIQNNKYVAKVKVNLIIYHPNDGDLIIQLKGPNGMLNLSQGNGSSGANYINTTFDDSASTPITQGIPPFTGSYKPQSPLSFFNNQPATAPWILRVFDSKTGNTGTLISWCILMQLKNSISVKEQNIPVKYGLSQNYPNPFNPTTNIKFQIKESGFVTLKVYDILGKEVTTLVNEKLKAGEYQAIFNGGGLASGIYFYKLVAGEFTDVKRMLLVK